MGPYQKGKKKKKKKKKLESLDKNVEQNFD